MERVRLDRDGVRALRPLPPLTLGAAEFLRAAGQHAARKVRGKNWPRTLRPALQQSHGHIACAAANIEHQLPGAEPAPRGTAAPRAATKAGPR